jgi:hypothetical protein
MLGNKNLMGKYAHFVSSPMIACYTFSNILLHMFAIISTLQLIITIFIIIITCMFAYHHFIPDNCVSIEITLFARLLTTAISPGVVIIIIILFNYKY